MRNQRHYVCKDCDAIFTVYISEKNRKKPCCPWCADSVSVYPYTAERNGKDKHTKQRWSDTELDVLREVVERREMPYRAAMRVGRSVNSVTKKVARMRQEAAAHGKG